LGHWKGKEDRGPWCINGKAIASLPKCVHFYFKKDILLYF